MALLSEQGYKNACRKVLKIRETGEIWVGMKHVGDGLGVKNMFDLVLKEICGIYEKKKLTKEEIKNYKMAQREIYEKLNYIQRVANLFMLKIMS